METYEDGCPSCLEEEVEFESLVVRGVQGEACPLVALQGVLVGLVVVLMPMKCNNEMIINIYIKTKTKLHK